MEKRAACGQVVCLRVQLNLLLFVLSQNRRILTFTSGMGVKIVGQGELPIHVFIEKIIPDFGLLKKILGIFLASQCWRQQ